MSKTIVHTKGAPEPIGPYSQAVLVNGTLYISGQICLDPESGELKNADVKEEAHRCMLNLKAVLAAAGMDFSHVVKTGIFLTDMGSFAVVNEVYGQYFESEFPARETVEVSALPKQVNVEISMVAVK
ncbi:MAG: RidA family protein [Chitinophagaceae bacterium]|nr:MAG: RidA family protein [Chitinophagaceae bacterium]